jgi:hypothetical protein
VTVTNQDGWVVGVGLLEGGHAGTETRQNSGGSWVIACRFGFLATNVPNADAYTVSVAGRDGPIYSYAEMVGTHWHVDVSLGE